MEEIIIKKELTILICHYLKNKNERTYRELSDFIHSQGLLPTGCGNIDDALNMRYQSFDNDQYLSFLKSLRPLDDFPSIFRRIVPFQKPNAIQSKSSIFPTLRVYCHKDPIYCMVTDPSSRILITGADDFSIKLWSIPKMDPITSFFGHENVITNISINCLSSLVLSSSHDRTLRLWSLITGKQVAVLTGFTNDSIHYCTFNATGSMVAAACEDGSIPLWSTSDALLQKPPTKVFKSLSEGSVRWLSFSPGCEFLVYCSEPSRIVVIALKSFQETVLEYHQSIVHHFSI